MKQTFGLFIACFLYLSGTAFFALLTSAHYAMYIESMSWPSAIATLEQAHLDKQSYRDESTREEHLDISLHLEYAFSPEKAQKTYKSTQVTIADLIGPTWWKPWSKTSMLWYVHHRSPELHVYYDAKDPTRCILWRGVSFWGTLLYTLCGMFLCPLVLLTISTLRPYTGPKDPKIWRPKNGLEILGASFFGYFMYAIFWIIAYCTIGPILSVYLSLDALVFIFPCVMLLCFCSDTTYCTLFPAVIRKLMSNVIMIYLLLIFLAMVGGLLFHGIALYLDWYVTPITV